MAMRVPLHFLSSSIRKLLILGGFFATALTDRAYPQQQTSEASVSIAKLRARAESGEPLARKQLSDLLVQGNLAGSDYDLVLPLIRSAASRKEPGGQFLLGYLYEHGLGVSRDYHKAAENYEAAALQGDPNGQNNLANLYHR